MSRHHFRRTTLLFAGAAFVLGLAWASEVQAQTVLRLIAQSDLTVLDPVFSTSNITSNHGYMVYDQLFGLDSKRIPQPQMVETHAKSADGLVWKFKLRGGLKFSDGSRVEAKDVVASVKRWAGRHAAGRTVMTRVKELVATGADTFEFRFSQPFAPLLAALAEPVLAVNLLGDGLRDALDPRFARQI
jgi:peptide/nickel transport system substrate-binding protein